MCDFKPGDEVVCINDQPYDGRAWTRDAPQIGETYTVVGFDYDPELDVDCVDLAEITNDHGDVRGYAAHRFRKVQRRDLTAWLSTAQTFEEPKRAPAKKRERAQ